MSHLFKKKRQEKVGAIVKKQKGRQKTNFLKRVGQRGFD